MKQKFDIGDKEKILLAEDNEVNLELATEMLRFLGYDVDIARDGKQALQALDQGDYQLVLMDCEMPVMNGCAATQAWRQRERETHRRPIPIIALTAGEKVRCLEAGMNDTLTKPFDYGHFSRTISRWLNAKGAEVESGAEDRAMDEIVFEADSKSPQPVLDQTQLDQLRNWRGKPNPELAERVMRLCLEQVTQLCADMREAAQRGDIAATAGMAHILKSSSGTVGAMRLMNLCHKIETSCETTGTIEMELITRAGEACVEAEAALKQELKLLV